VSGMAPKADRQRKVELSWHKGELEFSRPSFVPVIQPVKAPVLDTTALINTRAERLYKLTEAGRTRIDLGGPGDRQMVAIWKEEGRLLEMRAWVSNLADFEERLGWLTQVDSETWLDAMPAKVVKAADHDATVREMLKEIPLPATFKPSRIPDEGLTTNRDQVAGAVTGTVACLWFRQWGQARRTGDRASELQAERAMATSRRWPILRELSNGGGSPPLIWQLAAGMPSGEGRRGWRLLPQAEASPDDIEGGKMFATTCGFCHQEGGRHAGRGPKLSKSERSDEYIVERIKKGKVGAMPAYGGVFSDGQIIAILAYIRGLDD